MALCAEKKIPLYVYGGGSSVTRGVECMKGGISLDMRLRFNKVVSFNEVDQTITVEAGMSGPKLEQTLNDAPHTLGAKRAYTCGHFPQSFEYSSVGGWVVTRGAGQNSTYYGCISDKMCIRDRCQGDGGEVRMAQQRGRGIQNGLSQILIARCCHGGSPLVCLSNSINPSGRFRQIHDLPILR